MRVATGRGFRLAIIDTQTKRGYKHRRGLDTLDEIKFAHPIVSQKVKQIFGTSNYVKALVVWDVQDSQVIVKARDAYHIEIWKISDILNELKQELKTQAFRDDVLRTIQLISKMKE